MRIPQASLIALSLLGLPLLTALGDESVEIGSQRELFVDHHLIDQLDGARLKLHSPQPREIVFRFDQPWEGIYSGYETIIKDGAQFRLYYRGLSDAIHAIDSEVTCVAESQDGIQWTRPNVSKFSWRGIQDNNIVLMKNRGCHNFAPFLDANPNCPENERYKALGGSGNPGLLAYASPNGIDWRQLQEDPVITKGKFDSQNNAFWSVAESQYVCYFRVFRDGTRWIARVTSPDFIHWSEPTDLELDGKPRQQLYTNQIHPYPRAPHIYLGFPTRFMAGRRVVTEKEAAEIGTPSQWNYANDCTDVLFASTRGGTNFKRTFLDAFVRPGADLRNWTSRSNYAARGIMQTDDRELSIYVKHQSGYPSIHVRRYTLRPDGFVSVNAAYAGGELITRPIRFSGSTLFVNYATSAAGGMKVELRSENGDPIRGFTFDDCPEMIGDRLDHPVRWIPSSDLAKLQGQSIRLCVRLQDADLYSLQFRND